MAPRPPSYSPAGHKAMSAPDRTSLLLEYGARHDVFSAAGLGDVEEVYRHLTEAPHLIGRRDVRFHRTPLDWAVFFGQDAVIDYLLAAGAEPSPEVLIHRGQWRGSKPCSTRIRRSLIGPSDPRASRRSCGQVA